MHSAGVPPPGGAQSRGAELVALVGGREKAAAIRRILSGTPDNTGKPTYSFGARAGFFLRQFPEFSPKTPRARELYRHLADLTKSDEMGRPKPLSFLHSKLAAYLRCSTRTISAVLRELERTGLLPLIGVTPGKQGRASRFLFVCDPFTWAEHQDAEAKRVRAVRHARTVADQARAIRAGESGDVTKARAAQLEREAQRRREWNLPPRESRAERFQRRLSAAEQGADFSGLRATRPVTQVSKAAK
jgi:hypothetical protein